MKCINCDKEMLNGNLHGDPHIMDLDHEVDRFSVKIETGETSSFLGMTINETVKKPLEVKVCPKCGKVEMYVQPFESQNN